MSVGSTRDAGGGKYIGPFGMFGGACRALQAQGPTGWGGFTNTGLAQLRKTCLLF
jgi:hypothetical protein